MVNVIKFSEFADVNLTNTTNLLVGVSASSSGTNFKSTKVTSWTTAARPSPPFAGLLGFNIDLSQYEFWSGVAWVQLAAGGSGSVNPGSVNQIAYYATTGSAVSGLMGANSSVLVTNSSGMPNWVTTLPSSLTIPIPNITGVTDGSNAIPGSVGEFVTASVLQASAVSLTTGIGANVIVSSLSAGDWDVWGNVAFTAASTTNVQTAFGIVTLSSGSIGPTNLRGALPPFTDPSGANTPAVSVPMQRFNLTTNTPIYLVALSDFSAGTNKAFGFISARRVR